MSPYIPADDEIAHQTVLGRGWSSKGIAWFGGGGFSHEDFILPDGSLIGARSDVIDGIPAGVQIRPPFYDGLDGWAKRLIMVKKVSPDVRARCVAAALSQRGKPYDSTAIWGFVFGRNWRDLSKWFCSEYGIWVDEQGGAMSEVFPMNKIFPGEAIAIRSADNFYPVLGKEFFA